MKKQQPPKDITVRVDRAFCLEGEPVAVGTVLTLQTAFAVELLNAKKVSKTTEQPTSRPAAEVKATPAKPAGKKASAINSPVAPAKGE